MHPAHERHQHEVADDAQDIPAGRARAARCTANHATTAPTGRRPAPPRSPAPPPGSSARPSSGRAPTPCCRSPARRGTEVTALPSRSSFCWVVRMGSRDDGGGVLGLREVPLEGVQRLVGLLERCLCGLARVAGEHQRDQASRTKPQTSSRLSRKRSDVGLRPRRCGGPASISAASILRPAATRWHLHCCCGRRAPQLARGRSSRSGSLLRHLSRRRSRSATASRRLGTRAWHQQVGRGTGPAPSPGARRASAGAKPRTAETRRTRAILVAASAARRGRFSSAARRTRRGGSSGRGRRRGSR